ncbi:hypothetical protein [Streptomyces sp. NPDC101234]|uniref:glutamine amidotransferase-related protein n=1 Tax=Streptomyces sp. NPDC101234 TaxID=3366138 RepID=UPI00382CAF4F
MSKSLGPDLRLALVATDEESTQRLQTRLNTGTTWVSRLLQHAVYRLLSDPQVHELTACVEADKAVIGICLGAQLVGESLGAAWAPSPDTEIGSFPVTLTAAGREHPFPTGFGDSFDTGHWHNDMPGLTDDATVLATSAGCPRRIVAYSRYVYGFQCHMEFTPDCIEALIEQDEKELAALADRPYVQQPDQLRANDCTEMNTKLMTFLDRLAADYAAR